MENTIHHWLTEVFLRLITWKDIFLIVTESNCAENKGKYYTQDTNIEELVDVETDSFENVTNFWIIAEEIHDVYEVERRIEESSNKWDKDIEENSPELRTEVDWLCGISSF